MIDFSDYPQDSILFYLADVKVIGKMKEEFKGDIISEFLGFYSKMCSLVNVDDKENKIGEKSQ